MNRVQTTALTRRGFLRSSALALGFPAILRAQAVPPSRKITIAAIGTGPQGLRTLANFLSNETFQVVAVCDVAAAHRDAAIDKVRERYGKPCPGHADFRELLARDDIDGVLISIGERWHAPMSILAARAGKDIYCEKPASMAVNEMLALRAAVREHKVVYQCGTQRRSQWAYRYACDLARSGKLGKLHTLYAHTGRYGWNPNRPPGQPLPPKEKLDWDLWLGPSPHFEYNEILVNGGWRGLKGLADCGIEEIGAHGTDICQFARNADTTMPIHYRLADGVVTAEYADGVKMPFVEPPNNNRHRAVVAARFDGDDGWFYVDDDGHIEASHESLVRDFRMTRTRNWQDLRNWTNHVGDFANAVRQRSLPVSHIDATTRSIITCHLGGLVHQTGINIQWDPAAERLVGDLTAAPLFARAYREPWDKLIPLAAS